MPLRRKSFYERFIRNILIAIVPVLLLHACRKTDNLIDAGIPYGITGVEPQMAANGDTIRIYGAGFAMSPTGNTVTVHGVPATVVSATESLLEIVVPAAPRLGSIEVKTGSKSTSYTDVFTLATMVQGDQNQSLTWTPDHVYLLKGDVHLTKGVTLTVQAGTTVLADQRSLASLIVDDGATLLVNGTAANPVVFTSNQPLGLRYPGDWKGITLAATKAVAADHLQYARIEFAGYHVANQPGAALLMNRAMQADSLQYVEASYSAGDGFRCDVTTTASQYLKYLVAFGCAGNDFAFEGNSRGFGQFLLGLKDPAYADALGADGLLAQSFQPVTVSNLTLVSYSDVARSVTNQNPYSFYSLYNTVVNNNSGGCVHIGGTRYDGATAGGSLQLFNSLLAAYYLAGVAVDGPAAWAHYEDGTAMGTVIRHTTVTSVIRSGYNLYGPALPLVGYVFSAENLQGPGTGFQAVDASMQQAAFNQHNDTAILMMTQYPYENNKYQDDLGIQYLAAYKNLTGPQPVPQNGSPLFTGADFTDARLAIPFFNTTNTFRGSFGNTDWTKGWANYAPRQTAY